MANWKKNLTNYWLQQADKREQEEATATYEEKINKAWKACNDYVTNHQDDLDNFDITFFKQLLVDYVKATIPDATEERCYELANYCWELIETTGKELEKKMHFYCNEL